MVYRENTATHGRTDSRSVFGGFKNPQNHQEDQNETAGKNIVTQLLFVWGPGGEWDTPVERGRTSTNGQQELVWRV